MEIVPKRGGNSFVRGGGFPQEARSIDPAIDLRFLWLLEAREMGLFRDVRMHRR